MTIVIFLNFVLCNIIGKQYFEYNLKTIFFIKRGEKTISYWVYLEFELRINNN